MKMLKSAFASLVCLALAAGPAGAQSVALTRIGVAAAVSGSVMAFPPSPQPVGRIVQSGKPLFLNEKVTTDAKGRLQIMLPDETVFTIGPNSAMKLDEFVYDPATGAGKVSASILKGVFRFVTGLVAKNHPSDMRVNLPSGTLGIRGTIVAGTVDSKGAHCILLGPGPANNGGERVGSFSMENSVGSTEVNRPGFGSTMAEGQVPTPPALVSAGDLAALLGALAPSSEEKKDGTSEGGSQTSSSGGGDKTASGDGDSASSLGGQDTAGAGGDLDNTQSAGDTGAGGDSTASGAVQSVADPSIILNGASGWEDVRSIPTGAGVFSAAGPFNLTRCSGGACSSPSGSMDFVLNVDFANKTLGGVGGNGIPSYVAIQASDPGTSTSLSDSINIGAAYFGGASGPAVLFDKSASGNLSILFSLKNADGLAAAFAEAFAIYDDGSNRGTGELDAGFSGDRGDISAAIINALPSSTWNDIRTIPNGTGRYTGGGEFVLTQCAGGACVSPTGAFNFTLNVDFKNNTIGGDCNGSCVASQAFVSADDAGTNTSISDSLSVPAQSFSALSGNAVLTKVSDSGKFTMQYTLRNAGDFPAGIADALATYNDGSTVGSGDGFAGLQDTSNEILNGLTSTWDQVRNVPLGKGQFQASGPFNLTQCGGGSCANPFGSFGFLLNVDFARQTIGGDCNGTCVASEAVLAASDPGTNTSVSDSLQVPSQSFSALTGDAVLHQVSGSGFMAVDFTLKNANGIAGGLADALATYDDGLTKGSGEAAGGFLAAGVPPPANTATDAQWDDLRGIPTGRGRYSGFGPFNLTRCNGGSCQNPSGFMSFALNVDFANQTIGGDCGGGCVASQLLVSAEDSGTSTSISDSLTLSEQSYAGLGGNAAAAGQSASGRLGASFTIKNANGAAAGLADVAANYDDGSTAGSGEATGSLADVSGEVLNGLVSSWDQVRAVPSGTGKFEGTAPFTLTQCLGGSCTNPTGSFSYLLNVDFSNQVVGGDCNGGCVGSNASFSVSDSDFVSGGISDSLTIPAQSFSTLSGNAAIHEQSGSGFGIDFTLKNANGVAAALTGVVASFNDGSTIGSGSDSASLLSTTGNPLIFSGASSWDDVRSIPSGVGRFQDVVNFALTQCSGIACLSPVGIFEYALNIDFANQVIGGDCGGGVRSVIRLCLGQRLRHRHIGFRVQHHTCPVFRWKHG